jgi:IQ domain-containing protein H
MLEIIYICPYELSSDVSQYYEKVLSLSSHQSSSSRLYLLSPENHSELPSHYNLNQCILYSPKLIRRVKKIIRNKEAYIVPGFPSNDDIKVAALFEVPILAAEPQRAKVFTSKSGGLQFLEGLNIPIPLGVMEIYDLDELYNSFTLLISSNLNTETWLLKIDNEINGFLISI